ncbi:glycosyltransferase, partial [Pseudomonas savastanoi]
MTIGQQHQIKPDVTSTVDIEGRSKIAVLIPSYKVVAHILGVIADIGPEVDRIYVVDDCCPDNSGAYVEQHCNDPRVVVLRNPEGRSEVAGC